ncbi:hypothetical protein Lal_00039861 [Lupinus albus]|nr:hypothetical protein Lal_00039861 [Lupinus albus]
MVESKDFDFISVTTLFGKFQEYEIELAYLTLHEQTDKNNKEISFKATSSHSRREIDADESNYDIDDEPMSLFVNKFRKFLRK